MSNMYLSLLFAAVGYLATSAQINDNHFIKVSGIVQGIPQGGSRTIIINECDVSEKSKRCISELDSLGMFDVEVPFYFGHTFTINYNRGLFINAYAEPGDSIFVRIDVSKSPVEFKVSGDHARLNEEYSHAFRDLSPIYYSAALAPDTVALEEYMSRFKQEIARTSAEVDKYISEKELSPATAELLHLDNVFSAANMAIGFRGNGSAQQEAFFTDPLFDILNDRNTKVMIFPYHLSALMARCPDYVKSVPKCLARDLMYAAANGKTVPPRSSFVNEAYWDRLYADRESTSIDFSDLRPGNMTVMVGDTVKSITNANPIEWLKKQFPSRPIYMDVSATWCGPCRGALASTEDVRRHFRDSDVVFAVIWLKSDMESWKKLAPTIHDVVHIFIADEDMTNKMMGILNIQGFPSYYFINREGEITGKDIPHIGDPGIVDFLNASLNSHH